jgi:hypothetical protein
MPAEIMRAAAAMKAVHYIVSSSIASLAIVVNDQRERTQLVPKHWFSAVRQKRGAEAPPVLEWRELLARYSDIAEYFLIGLLRLHFD